VNTAKIEAYSDIVFFVQGAVCVTDVLRGFEKSGLKESRHLFEATTKNDSALF